MPNKFVLDTSFISSLYNPLDPNRNDAVKIFQKFLPQDEIIIPFSVLIELCQIDREISKHESSDILAFVSQITNKFIWFDEDYLSAFYKFVSGSKLKLKSIDYTILFTAINRNAELITFDKKLSQVYQSIIN